MYRCGNLVDVEMSLSCEAAFLRERIAPPLHGTMNYKQEERGVYFECFYSS